MTNPKKLVRHEESQPPPTQTTPQLDINSLMTSAQNIVKSITSEDKNKLNNMDMNQMFDHVTETVFQNLEKGGNRIDPASKQQMKVMSKMMLGTVMENIEGEADNTPGGKPGTKSKIDLGDGSGDDNVVHSQHTQHAQPAQPPQHTQPAQHEDKIPQKKELFEELSPDTEVDEFRPIADDLYYNLPVTLEELYTGRTKKLLVSRERLGKTGSKLTTEKRKFEVKVLPGMKHGQEIRFNKEGNEKYGYRAGDIIITLSLNSHPHYERIGNALCYVKNISLYESYAAAKGIIKVVIKHLDGTYLVLKVDDGVPLHAKDGARKIRKGGMPWTDKKTGKVEYGDLYIRFNLILPSSFDNNEGVMDVLEKMFPVLPTNKDSIIYNVPSPGRFSNFDSTISKNREVHLEDLTQEDLDQLDYDENPSDSEYSYTDSGSGSGSGSGSE